MAVGAAGGMSEVSDAAAWLFTVAAVAVVAAMFVLYLYAPYWGVRKVPGPPATPLVGHLPLLAKHGPDVFAVLAKTYGPVFRFHLGRQPIIIVADPELCKEVGIKKFKSITNRSLPSPIAGSPLHQKGLFFTRDSRWQAMRNTIISLYQPSHLASLIPVMQSYIESATQTFCSNQEKDLTFSDLSLKLATDVIGQAAFGADFGLSKEGSLQESNVDDDDVSAFVKEHIYSTTSLKMDLSGSFSIIVGLLVPILQEPCKQILKRIPGTADWKIEKANSKLGKRLNEIVAKREQEKERDCRDFLSAILNARESNDASRELFTSDYVIKEAMRFYTVSPLIARETSQKVDVGGYLLPKGTWVWLAPGVLAKDPKSFPNPNEFRPERFDPDCEEEKQRHPYAHIPFGIGPRSCIGQKFSLQEIKLSVIHLYRSYVFGHSPQMESPLQFQYGMVLNFKHGVKLRVIRRHNA